MTFKSDGTGSGACCRFICQLGHPHRRLGRKAGKRDRARGHRRRRRLPRPPPPSPRTASHCRQALPGGGCRRRGGAGSPPGRVPQRGSPSVPTRAARPPRAVPPPSPRASPRPTPCARCPAVAPLPTPGGSVRRQQRPSSGPDGNRRRAAPLPGKRLRARRSRPEGDAPFPAPRERRARLCRLRPSSETPGDAAPPPHQARDQGAREDAGGPAAGGRPRAGQRPRRPEDSAGGPRPPRRAPPPRVREPLGVPEPRPAGPRGLASHEDRRPLRAPPLPLPAARARSPPRRRSPARCRRRRRAHFRAAGDVTSLTRAGRRPMGSGSRICGRGREAHSAPPTSPRRCDPPSAICWRLRGPRRPPRPLGTRGPRSCLF